MKPETLAIIKKDIFKFKELFNLIEKHWGDARFTLIKVLLQNMAFDGSKTVNYQHDKEVSKINHIQKTLSKLSDYYGSYIEKWVKEEIDMIILGHTMSEQENTYEPGHAHDIHTANWMISYFDEKDRLMYSQSVTQKKYHEAIKIAESSKPEKCFNYKIVTKTSFYKLNKRILMK